MLRWQSRRLHELAIGRDEHIVHVQPELVVEVEFNEIQSSPHYTGGVALRFARVKGIARTRTPRRPIPSTRFERFTK